MRKGQENVWKVCEIERRREKNAKVQIEIEFEIFPAPRNEKWSDSFETDMWQFSAWEHFSGNFEKKIFRNVSCLEMQFVIDTS